MKTARQKFNAGIGVKAENDGAVAEYLREHPGGLECRPEALLALSLGHSPGAGVSSLVQRQLARLRRSKAELESRIGNLSALARDNGAAAEKIHRLSVALLRPGTVVERFERLRASLRRDFLVDRSALLLFPPLIGNNPIDGFVKAIDRRDPRLKAFAGWLDTTRPRCGPLHLRHRTFAFGVSGTGLESAATVPLGEDARLGFLVMASRDSERFNRGQHVDLLRLLGEFVAVALIGSTATAA